jgi:hypothetical protein
MTMKRNQRPTRVFFIALTSALAILSIGRLIHSGHTAGIGWLALEGVNLRLQNSPPPVAMTLDLNRIERDAKLAQMVHERKQRLGIETSLDLIAKADEAIRIGSQTVAMEEILARINSADHGSPGPPPSAGANAPTGYYGIYVVDPADTIWSIHIKLLKEYLAHRGITLFPIADEPDRHGFSSGEGKILNFPDEMAHIYNIEQHRIERDLNRVSPMNELIVYNLRKISALADQIEHKNMDHVEFDGQTVWIPSGR